MTKRVIKYSLHFSINGIGKISYRLDGENLDRVTPILDAGKFIAIITILNTGNAFFDTNNNVFGTSSEVTESFAFNKKILNGL